MPSSCKACGLNPVPHFMTRVTESWVVATTPASQWVFGSWLGRLASRGIDGIFFGLFVMGKQFGFIRASNNIADSTIARSRVLWEEAKRRGITLETHFLFGKEIDYYHARLGDKEWYFSGLPRRDYENAALFWMDDKATLKKKLQAAGVPVPRGGAFSSERQALQFFLTLTKPVIIKPRVGSRGRHTSTFLYTEEAFKKAFRLAKQLCYWVVVDEQLFGSVQRGTVIDGVLRGVLGGEPPRVTGDGVSTIRQLIDKKNATRDPRIGAVGVNGELIDFLARQRLALESVLEPGKTVDLSVKIGIANGGTSEEWTTRTHPKLKVYLERAAAAVGDAILGFDFIIQDVMRDPDEQRWGIIECNGLPFIQLHHHPLYGEPVNVARYVWDLVSPSNP